MAGFVWELDLITEERGNHCPPGSFFCAWDVNFFEYPVRQIKGCIAIIDGNHRTGILQDGLSEGCQLSCWIALILCIQDIEYISLLASLPICKINDHGHGIRV